ncbi:hypothetical protein Neosp_013333 [[Neocosmospora] mangrovei]
MSGIEVAGLVLGGFPILLNCLDYYRKGFEPLEEWFSFRTHFIAFVDNIRHQMMRYNENMIRLLDPIVGDSENLAKLITRIVDRMQEVMLDLNKLLQIEDGQVSWIGSSQHKPWQWHFKRVQISFSKGKHKKVKKLASHNQELQEILGYSERIIPISDKRKSSEPVGRLEKLRQHACLVHNALKWQWKCNESCHRHEAHLGLRAEAVSISMNVMFIVQGGQGTSSKPITQEVVTQTKEALPPMLSDISHVPQSVIFTTVQQTIVEQDNLAKSKLNFISRLSQRFHVKELSLKGLSGKAGTQNSLSTKKSVRFGPPVPIITISPPCNSDQSGARPVHSPNATPIAGSPVVGNPSTPLPISDLCLRMVISEGVRLYPLPELLDAYHQAAIELSRQLRFEMATHIASALLQVHRSPWLSAKWPKRDFYFLADMDSQSLRSSHPFVSRNFLSGSDDEEEATASEIPNFPGNQQASEEDTRACLFTVGVMILELIFGHNIEDCGFRKDYYGKNNQPNDQTDISTARKWAKKVLGDSGANVADVVRRCLDCSFGPKPCFADVRFRNSVYEGVIKPLASYSKVWPEAMP